MCFLRASTHTGMPTVPCGLSQKSVLEISRSGTFSTQRKIAQRRVLYGSDYFGVAPRVLFFCHERAYFGAREGVRAWRSFSVSAEGHEKSRGGPSILERERDVKDAGSFFSWAIFVEANL